VPPTSTPFASSREAQSSGPQWEGGFAVASGFTIAFDMVDLPGMGCSVAPDRSSLSRRLQARFEYRWAISVARVDPRCVQNQVRRRTYGSRRQEEGDDG